MGARAMWKAALRIDELAVPVKLYAGVEERGVHFRLLEARTRVPVQQRMIDPRTGNEVAAAEIRRGIAVEPGVLVMLDDAEIEAAVPNPSREIEVTRFVPPQAIDAAFYARPYFLGPDGSGEAYGALAQALASSGLRGIARWTMRGKRYFGALVAQPSRLALIALRSADSVVSADALTVPESKVVSAAERKLAEQLIGALDGPFEPEALRDEHRARVLAWIDARARGRRLRLVDEAVPRPSTDLKRALERSIAHLEKRSAA